MNCEYTNQKVWNNIKIILFVVVEDLLFVCCRDNSLNNWLTAYISSENFCLLCWAMLVHISDSEVFGGLHVFKVKVKAS